MGKSKSPALEVTEVLSITAENRQCQKFHSKDKLSVYCSLNVINSTMHCSVQLQSKCNGIDWEQQMVRNINTGAEH